MVTNWISVVIPIITTVLGALLGYYFSRIAHKQKLVESQTRDKMTEEKLKQQKRLTFYRLMTVHLNASHDAFIDQARIRNRLLRMLGHDPRTFDWENLEETLAQAYPNLNDEQRTLFDLIRGITENSLFHRNKEMLTLLNVNSNYFHELPEFKDLQGHIELWLAKFEAILKQRQDYCIVYVGLKEKKPFPVNIHEKVGQAISEMEGAA